MNLDDMLKDNIRSGIAEIQPHLWDSIMKNFSKRIVLCHRRCGGHFVIIFNT